MPELLRWAHERSGLSDEALRAHFPEFRLWQSAEQMPAIYPTISHVIIKPGLTHLSLF